MPGRSAMLAAVCALTLAGCGASPRDAVRDKVQQFAQATAHHDYRTLCAQVLAPALVERLQGAGISCEQAMKVGLGPVQSPTVSIGSVTVSGAHATVIVLTVARGQAGSVDTLGLTRTSSGWRISALSGPPGG